MKTMEEIKNPLSIYEKEALSITDKYDDLKMVNEQEDLILDIHMYLVDMNAWMPLIGTEADILTSGEFTRRYWNAHINLEERLSKLK